MQPTALHPFDPAIAAPFVLAMTTPDAPMDIPNLDHAWGSYLLNVARSGYAQASRGQQQGYQEITTAFGQLTAALHPSFQHEGLSLTSWEAQIDRGAGMLMRPPSRLFIQVGLDPVIGRQLAIRLDFTYGMMGGAFVPPQLVPQLATLIESRFDRLVMRLVAAEIDPYPHMTLLTGAVNYAAERGLGLYETLGVVMADVPESVPPGGGIVLYDRKRSDPALRKRIEIAANPPKEAGKLARLLGRGKQTPIDDFPSMNGHVKLDD